MDLEATSMTIAAPIEANDLKEFFPVIFIVIGIVGAFGNTLVCVVITSMMAWTKSGKTNLLILHQAFIDDITSVVLILTYALRDPDVPKAGGWGEFLCRTWVARSLLWMLFVVSTYNLCMMSLERFVAVAYPLTYSTKFNKRSSILMILFCWVIAPLLHYYYPVGTTYNDRGKCGRRGDPEVKAAVGIMVFFWEFFIPFVIMAVVYVRIVYLLRKQHQRVQTSSANTSHQEHRERQPCGQPRQQLRLQVSPLQSEEQSQCAPTGTSQGQFPLQVSRSIPQEESYNQQGQQQPHHQPQKRPPAQSGKVRRNVTFTLLAVFIMYVACWMPNHLTFLQHGFGGPLDYDGTWLNFTLVLAYLNMSINPLIYALKYKLFREGFKRLFCLKCIGHIGRGSFAGSFGTTSSGTAPTTSERN